MMQRRHRIHEVSHVTRARRQSALQRLYVGARVPKRNDPAAFRQFIDQLNASVDFGRDRRHVHGLMIVNCRQRVEILSAAKGPKVLTVQSPTLLTVNKRTFVVDAQRTCGR